MIHIPLLPNHLVPVSNAFREEITARREEIDEVAEHDWYGLAFGFALGKGLSIDDADTLAIYIRHHDFYF